MEKVRPIGTDVGVKVHRESDPMSELAKKYANWLHGYAESILDETFGRGHIWHKPMTFAEFCANEAKRWLHDKENRE
jgi:hypothetical protein